MTDEQIKKLIGKWQQLFLLGAWQLCAKTIEGDTFTNEAGKSMRGEVEMLGPATAMITIARDQTDAEILETVQHELAHIAVQELYHLAWYATSNDAVKKQAETLYERAARQVCHALQALCND